MSKILIEKILRIFEEKEIRRGAIFSVLILTACIFLLSCSDSVNTEVSVKNGRWYLNNRVINKGTPAEGLLMNVRMVNTAFEDRAKEKPEILNEFDSEENTNNFISKIPEYAQLGVNAFTISLQGGNPGYEGAVNSAFSPDGSLRKEYLERIEKIINVCDQNHIAVILTCFYQRQHSNFSSLSGEKSMKNAVQNTVLWITKKNFKNVMLDISNEYKHPGYYKWKDGAWLVSEEGQIELMKIAREINPNLLISTSGMGDGIYHNKLIKESDFLLIHFNTTFLDEYTNKIKALKKHLKPVVANEDDKTGETGAMAMALAVKNGCGWGYMNEVVNQYAPFSFQGADDDLAVYEMFDNVTSSDYKLTDKFNEVFLGFIYPQKDNAFERGEMVNVKLSIVNLSDTIPYRIEVLCNDEIFEVLENSLTCKYKASRSGSLDFQAILKNTEGEELCRSSVSGITVE